METSQFICCADMLVGLCMVQVFESDFQAIYYVTDFYNILPHIVKLNTIETFKKLQKSESVNRSDLLNSAYLQLNFSILLFNAFLEIVIISVVFLCLYFYSPCKHKQVYMEVKLYHQIEVFMPEYLNAISELNEASLTPQLTVFAISKVN